MVNVAPLEGRTDLAAKQRVLVGLGNSIEARMKFVVGLGRVEYPDGRRQQAVDGPPQIVRRNGIVNV